MPRKSKAWKKRSDAAKKGWETRRKRDPRRWGRSGVAERPKRAKKTSKSDSVKRKKRKRVPELVRRQRREIARLERELARAHEAAERAAMQEEIVKRLVGEETLERFVSLTSLPRRLTGESSVQYVDRIAELLRPFYDVEGMYREIAHEAGLPAREVYSFLMGSPGVDWVA